MQFVYKSMFFLSTLWDLTFCHTMETTESVSPDLLHADLEFHSKLHVCVIQFTFITQPRLVHHRAGFKTDNWQGPTLGPSQREHWSGFLY